MQRSVAISDPVKSDPAKSDPAKSDPVKSDPVISDPANDGLPESGHLPSSLPKVSCLMVTADRLRLARRAVRCFARQSWPNKELVIIDDGQQDYRPILDGIPSHQVIYEKIPKRADAVLGTLRNLALDRATGDYLIQWDDDDWYHPDRITRQAEFLTNGFDACCLSASLMHLNTPEFAHLPYIGTLPGGIPGSIMHRRDAQIRYPEMRRSEDTVYARHWMERRFGKLPPDHSGLFIRCFHGTNTWEQEHFERRIRNSPKNWVRFMYYKHLRRNLSGHPLFRLSAEDRRTFEQYLDDSRSVGLM